MPAVSACSSTVVLREVFCAVHPLQSNFGEGDLIPALVLFRFFLLFSFPVVHDTFSFVFVSIGIGAKYILFLIPAFFVVVVSFPVVCDTCSCFFVVCRNDRAWAYT